MGAVLAPLTAAFRQPTAERFVVLLLAALLTPGARTSRNLRPPVLALAPGPPARDHRVFSPRGWSPRPRGRAVAGYLLTRGLPTGTVALAGDATGAAPRGPHGDGKAGHRAAVRSPHSDPADRWGHQWVVLVILVQFPCAPRP